MNWFDSMWPSTTVSSSRRGTRQVLNRNLVAYMHNGLSRTIDTGSDCLVQGSEFECRLLDVSAYCARS